MAYYRCYLLDEDGRIQSREEYESESRTAAIEAARRMFVQRPHHKAFEVWQGARARKESNTVVIPDVASCAS